MAYEQMIFLRNSNNKLIIQSRWNNRNLSVKPNGECIFATHNQLLWEEFDIESDEKGHVFFISCHTGKVMQCNEAGVVCCDNDNRLEYESWRIIYPHSTLMPTSVQINTIVIATAGAIFCPVLGLISMACVPAAMSTFGTVVAGVGTFHAPFVAGGVAATLQVAGGALLTFPAAAVGGIVGAIVGNKI